MISPFASETARPAIILPEQNEVLAHGGLLGILFYRSLQILALPRLLKREIFTLSIVAEVWVKRKSNGRYFWDPIETDCQPLSPATATQKRIPQFVLIAAVFRALGRLGPDSSTAILSKFEIKASNSL